MLDCDRLPRAFESNAWRQPSWPIPALKHATKAGTARGRCCTRQLEASFHGNLLKHADERILCRADAMSSSAVRSPSSTPKHRRGTS